ncbi:unnamed protein product [Euphydryas editha]|uniref:CHAD domain-containing protein n=1 Tax=Euphydryas editha TaxID=104508 RepID=A0AAU9VC94_EUPED|nr:unnamed protein product [Euphydryas editha]
MTTESMKDLNRRRGSIRNRLTAFEKYVTPLLDVKEFNTVQLNQLRLRLTTMRELVLSFDDIQTQIELLDDDETGERQSDERESTENRFYEVIAKTLSLNRVF